MNIKKKNLKSMHKYINKICFDGELETPAILESVSIIQMFGYNAITGFKIEWRGLCVDGNHGVYIAIGNWLPLKETFEVLIHEMVHQWQIENNYKLSHGKQFKAKCDKIYQNLLCR